MQYGMPFNGGMFGQAYGAPSGRPAWVDEMIRQPEYDHPGLQPRGQMNTYLHQLEQTDKNAYNSLVVDLAQKNKRLYKDWLNDQNRRADLLRALRTKNDPASQAQSDYQDYLNTGRKRTNEDLRWWDRDIAKADEEQKQYASQFPATSPRQEVQADLPGYSEAPASYGQERGGDSIRKALGIYQPPPPPPPRQQQSPGNYRKLSRREEDARMRPGGGGHVWPFEDAPSQRPVANTHQSFLPGMAEPIQPSYGTPYQPAVPAWFGQEQPIEPEPTVMFELGDDRRPPASSTGRAQSIPPQSTGTPYGRQAPPAVDIRSLLKEKGADPDSWGSDPNQMSPTRNWLNYWSSNSDGKVDPALQKQAQELKGKLSGAYRASQEAGLAQADEMRRRLQVETAKKQAAQPAQPWRYQDPKAAEYNSLGYQYGDHAASRQAYLNAAQNNWNDPEWQATLKKNKGKSGWRDAWVTRNWIY